MNSSIFLAHTLKLVTNDELISATRQLTELLSNSPSLIKTTSVATHYYDIMKQVRVEVVGMNDGPKDETELKQSLIKLLEEIKHLESIPQIRKELEKALSQMDNDLVLMEKMANEVKEAPEEDEIDYSFLEKTVQKNRFTRLAILALIPILGMGAAFFLLRGDLSEKMDMDISSFEQPTYSYQSIGSLDSTISFYQSEVDSFRVLYKTYPENVKLKSSLALSYSKLGSTHSLVGNLDSALRYYELGLRLNKELSAAYPQYVELKSNLAVSNEKLGNIHLKLGNLFSALQYFKADSRLFEGLYNQFPQNADLKNKLAVSYEKQGTAHLSLGNPDSALMLFDRSARIFSDLYNSFPDNVNFRSGYALLFERRGSAHMAKENFHSALGYFREYTRLGRQLYYYYSEDVDIKSSVAVSYEKLGLVHLGLGNVDSALSYLGEQVRLNRELYDTYPEYEGFRSSLLEAYERLAGTHNFLGNLPNALDYYLLQFELVEELTDNYPEKVEYREKLIETYEKVAKTYTNLGFLDSALNYYEAYTQLNRDYYEFEPDNPKHKKRLAASYLRLADFYKKYLYQKESARKYYQQAENLFLQLVRYAPDDSSYSRRFTAAYQAIFHMEVPFYKPMERQIYASSDTTEIHRLYGVLCDSMRSYISRHDKYQHVFARALNSRAWFSFFVKDFDAAEQAIIEGMSLETDNRYLPSNLPHIFLFKGEIDKARRIYKQWRYKPFLGSEYETYQDAYLEDLKAFEMAGIVPRARYRDFQEIKQMLGG